MARSCRVSVEVLEARSATTRVLANPDGSSTMEISAAPRWVKRQDGAWAEIDTALRPNADGSLSPGAVPLDVRFSGGGTGPMVVAGRGGRRVSLTWPEALPRPSVAGDTATYAEVLPGVDLLLRATAGGFTHVFVVRSAQAAANPALRRLSFGVAGTGVVPRANGQGGVDAAATGGTELLHSGGATMWDSSTGSGTAGQAATSSARSAGEHARLGEVRTRFADGRFVLEPDPALLTAPTTRFPVYIDPAYLAPGFSRWAYATGNDINRNDGWARIGREPDGANYLTRSFFEFPTSSGSQTLAGARIMSAGFSIVLYHSSSCGTSPARLWHSTAISTTPRTQWSPALLGSALDTQWEAANKDSCYTSRTPTMTFSGGLAADIQANTGASSYTLALTAQDECDCEAARSQWKKFFPDTATLVVQYNHDPAAPVSADMTMGPPGENTVGCGATARVNSTSGLRLRARLTDGDGDNVRAQWSVSGIAAQYRPPDSAFAAPDTEFTADLPAVALPDGSYSWTVRGDDGTHAGAYGPSCQFVVDNTLPGTPSVTSTDLALGQGLIVPPAPATAVVGRAAGVTLRPAAADRDVAGYLIGLGAGAERPPSIWVPAGPDGSVVAPVVPLTSTVTNLLTVRARDLTGQLGGMITYRFRANAGTIPRVRGDATGDGLADPTTLAEAGSGMSSLWRWDGLPDGSGVRAPVAPQDAPGSYPTASTVPLQGDFDGDGRSDVALFQPKATGSQLTVQRSDGDNFLGSSELWSDASWSPDRLKHVAGDFTGDGVDDLLVVKDEGSATWKAWVFAATGSPGTVEVAAPVAWWASPAGVADWTRMKVVAGDFTGDGRDDFGYLYDAGSCNTKVVVHASGGSAFQTGFAQFETGTGACWDRTTYVAGDFTGDGLDDLAGLVDAGSCQTTLWTRAAYRVLTRPITYGFAAPVRHFDSGQHRWCADAVEPSAGDVNGDGRTDISVVYRCCGSRQFSLWRFLSTGDALAPPVRLWRGTLGLDGISTVSVDPAAAYELVARHSGMCVDVRDTSIANGATVWQWGCHGYSNQSFRLVPVGAAYYTLRPAHTSGMCLSAGSPTANGTVAFQYQCGPSPGADPFGDQVYQVAYAAGSGEETVVRLRPLHSGKCMDVSWGSLAAGAVLHQWDCHGGANQDFSLLRTSVVPYYLKGSYAMNEAGGGTLADTSGRAATATLTGGATVAGGHATFNGTSAYAATSGPAVDTGQSFSVSAWVRLTSGAGYATAVSQDGVNVAGFNLGYQPPADGNVWALELRNSDAYAYGGKSRAVAPATLNTWTHLVGVRDVGANQLRLYVNGQLAGSASYTYRWNAGGRLTIGRTWWLGVPADWWPGDIDDVRVYGKVLGADEIATLAATRG